jgi:glyoxylase-like metal-dependent hydrolase (beta-lactamase superfamily II)
MQILSNTGGIAATNCYLIADEATGQAVLFDAPDHTVAPLLEEAKKRKWNIIGLWLTHGHFDHIADHALVTKNFPNAKVLIHRLDKPQLIEPNTKFFPLPFEIPSRKADGYIEDGQTLKIGDIPLTVIHTPGHSPGHVMYHFPDQNILIGGDLIFVNSVGRTDLPDSDPAKMRESIRRVMKLPPLTRLLPGHAGVTTLADEAAGNPYVIEALSPD